MKHRNRGSEDFEKQVGALENTWPSAHRFLCALSDNRRGFWLNEDKNAHSFYKDGFIVHLKLGHNEMEFSPRFHSHIPGSTHDRSDILFSKIDSLIIRHGGIAKRWAFPPFDGPEYTICRPAPQEFFDDILRTIEDGYQAAS